MTNERLKKIGRMSLEDLVGGCRFSFLLIFILLSAINNGRCFPSSSRLSTLELVQFVFRHGDRTPTFAWGDSDPNPASQWPGGFAKLTDLGRSQMYRLGELTRKSYADLFEDNISPINVSIRSSRRDRAVSSSRCFAAGLFSSASSGLFEDTKRCDVESDLDSLIETETQDDLWIMSGIKACPKTTRYYLNAYYCCSPRVIRFIEENRDVIDFVTKATGLYVKGDDRGNLQNMWKVSRNLAIARLHGKELPSWATNDLIDRLQELRIMSLKGVASASPQLVRIAGGTLLAHFLLNFRKATNATLHRSNAEMANLRIMAFSGHDSNVIGLLAALGLFKPAFAPAYTAAIYLELHRSAELYFVKVFFRENVDSDLRELSFPDCPTPCPLDQLLRLYNSTMVTSKNEFHSLCSQDRWQTGFFDSLKSPSVVVLLLSFMLASCLPMMAFNRRFWEAYASLFRWY